MDTMAQKTARVIEETYTSDDVISDLDLALTDVEKGNEEIALLVDRLRDRVSPVLRPTDPSPPETTELKASRETSAVVHRLREAHDRQQALAYGLRMIIERLTV